jgi:hypothetical protein
VLAGLRAQLRGSVKFIFQPAEEMPPEGEDGGAKMMVAEGALENPTPQAIFGLHVTSLPERRPHRLPAGPTMASSDKLKITVHGRQTHGAAPWLGVDPIVTAAQVVLGLQTVVSRGIDLTSEPAVVTIGAIHGGVRENIIPDRWRCAAPSAPSTKAMRDDIHERVTTLAEAVSRGSRAGCTVCITKNYPVTINDPALTTPWCPRCSAWPATAAAAGAQGHRARKTSRSSSAWCRGCSSSWASRPRRAWTRRRPGAQPFAALLRRRIGPAAGRARAGAPGLRLPRVLVGPGAGCLPDVLFKAGVTALAGTWVHDRALFAHALAQGGRWSAAARKFLLQAEAWPPQRPA